MIIWRRNLYVLFGAQMLSMVGFSMVFPFLPLYLNEIGGMIPSLNALMNCHAPSGSQGATYGLNASITAAGRSIAPMLGATIAMWFGMRSVFVVAAAIYGLAVLVVLFISRTEYIKNAS